MRKVLDDTASALCVRERGDGEMSPPEGDSCPTGVVFEGLGERGPASLLVIVRFGEEAVVLGVPNSEEFTCLADPATFARCVFLRLVRILGAVDPGLVTLAGLRGGGRCSPRRKI